MGPLGAACEHSFTDEPREISKEEWDKVRFGQVCTISDNLANWKGALIKLCNDTNQCTYEQRKVIEDLGKRFNRMNWKVYRAWQSLNQ